VGQETERGAAMLIHLHKQATTTPKVRAASLRQFWRSD
jgi:hypothetical protein